MALPEHIRAQFQKWGRDGGRKRASQMEPSARRAVARRAGIVRWTRHRFGTASFAELGLPGGDLVDAGLADLAEEKTTIEGLLVSIGAPRLRREGVPMGGVEENPEVRLYTRLEKDCGELAHSRYNAYLRQMSSFADACRFARIDRSSCAPND